MAEDTELASGTWTQGAQAQAMRVRKCRIEVVSGPDKGKAEVFAQPTIVVGREGADFVLSDRRISALHFELSLEQSGYRLRDLQSTNGTHVWGMRVVEVFVGPGATIALGDSAVRFLPQHESIEIPLWNEPRYCSLVGGSAVMRSLYATIERLAATDCTVLVMGETGTGKELVADAIHQRSARAKGPFVVLDCGAVPAQLFEDQLFGHEAGAYTDARQASIGVFEQAHGGTLLLDEIGELPVELQPKLLRAVETRRISRIGSARTIDCDVRVVAATNRDLSAEVNRKAFRSDLYFRIAVARVQVPPLRARLDDVDLLIDHFVGELAKNETMPDDFRAWSRRHNWPGNVRELRNTIERALLTRELPALEESAAETTSPFDVDLSVPFKEAKRRLVDAFDRRYLTALLEAHGGNIASAARAAGIDRMSIYKMLQRVDVRRPS